MAMTLKSHALRRPTTPRPESDPVRFGAKERDYVFSIAMKYVKDEEDAADVTQEALLLAYRHRASFRGASRYTTWLYRIRGHHVAHAPAQAAPDPTAVGHHRGAVGGLGHPQPRAGQSRDPAPKTRPEASKRRAWPTLG